MRYTEEVTINKPRDEVLALFDNPDNMRHWQTGFISMTPMEGAPGQVGSTSKLHYKIGKREVEMVETITVRDLPEKFCGTYEAKGVWNALENRFEALDAGTTKWTSEVEFRFSSWMMKIMALVMPGAFRKQTRTFMEDFKAFAEQGISVADRSG